MFGGLVQLRPLKQSTNQYALEITGKDIAQIEAAKAAIPPGTPVNIAFLRNESHCQRVDCGAGNTHRRFRASADNLIAATA